MAAHSSSPNLSDMPAVRLLSVVFIPNERNIDENHLLFARVVAYTMRFCNVDLERRTAAKELKKRSSKSPRNWALVIVAFIFRAFAIIALPPTGNEQLESKVILVTDDPSSNALATA
jgi:hypothetical protein